MFFSSVKRYKHWNLFSSKRYHRFVLSTQEGKREIISCFALQEGDRVAKLLGCDCADLYKNLLKPRIKVGNEFVTQGRNKDQVAYSVGAMSKAMFDRLFKWLVKKCNETLDTKQKRQHFIGVLDIAGFEIFDVSFSRATIHKYIDTDIRIYTMWSSTIFASNSCKNFNNFHLFLSLIGLWTMKKLFLLMNHFIYKVKNFIL